MNPEKKELLFHRFWPGLLCLFIFQLGNLIGLFRLLCWHFPMMLLMKTFSRPSQLRHARFVYRYMKATDHVACVSLVNGRSDETISNKAGRLYKEQGTQCPRWALEIKRLTDSWEKDHVINSIEPLRAEPFGDIGMGLFDKMGWFENAILLMPGLPEEEYEIMWEKFQTLTDGHPNL